MITGEIINSDVSEYTVGTKNEGDDKKEEEEIKEEEVKKENEEEKMIKSSMQKKENVEFGLDDKSNMDIEHISNKFNSVNKENDWNSNSCHEGDLDSGILSETADQHSSLPVELQSKNECHILLTAEENIDKNILNHDEDKVEILGKKAGEEEEEGVKEEEEAVKGVEAKVEMLKRRTLSQIRRQGKQSQKEKEKDKKGGTKEREERGKQEGEVEKEEEEEEDFDFDEENDLFDGN